MRKPPKVTLYVIAALAVTAVVLVGRAVHKSWEGWYESKIVMNGPFASCLPSLYPDHRKDIKAWFLNEIPIGTPREKAKGILAKSFSVDLTTGRWIEICATGSLAGGSSTTVQLHFDRRGNFLGVEIKQYYAPL